MAKGHKADFPDEGVRVTVPAQKDKKTLRAVKLPLGTLGSMPGAPGRFQPERLVINFALEEEGKPGTYLTEFDPPIELRVRYTKADHDRASRAGHTLKLAFWDGGKWVPFTPQKHQFRLEPDANPNKGGHGVAVISRWDDPPIGWGR